MVERSSSPRVISTGSVIPATPRTITPRTSTKRRFFRHSFVSISCLRPQPVTEPIREHLVLAFDGLSNPTCRPSGLQRARRAFLGDIWTSTILTVDAKSVDSIFGWAQRLRVAMHAACWGKSASKFCTIGSASGSPQTQHRSEYRSLAVMRSAQTA